MLFKQTQQEVGNDLGVCVLNLQIIQQKSKSLTKLLDKSYHETLRDHVFKGLRDLMGWTFL